MIEDLITTKEAAEILGCSPRTVHRMVDTEELIPVAQVRTSRHGAYLFKRSDIEQAPQSRVNPDGIAS